MVKDEGLRFSLAYRRISSQPWGPGGLKGCGMDSMGVAGGHPIYGYSSFLKIGVLGFFKAFDWREDYEGV